jgi:hypothetical protein
MTTAARRVPAWFAWAVPITAAVSVVVVTHRWTALPALALVCWPRRLSWPPSNAAARTAGAFRRRTCRRPHPPARAGRHRGPVGARLTGPGTPGSPIVDIVGGAGIGKSWRCTWPTGWGEFKGRTVFAAFDPDRSENAAIAVRRRFLEVLSRPEPDCRPTRPGGPVPAARPATQSAPAAARGARQRPRPRRDARARPGRVLVHGHRYVARSDRPGGCAGGARSARRELGSGHAVGDNWVAHERRAAQAIVAATSIRVTGRGGPRTVGYTPASRPTSTIHSCARCTTTRKSRPFIAQRKAYPVSETRTHSGLQDRHSRHAYQRLCDR